MRLSLNRTNIELKRKDLKDEDEDEKEFESH